MSERLLAPEHPPAATPNGRGTIARLIGIDLARFLAIVGMVCAHLLPSAGMPGNLPWLDLIVDGNASTLFAVIGGISVVLATRRSIERGEFAAARWALAARGVLVILIGLTIALVPGSIIVVLVYFGVTMLLCIPFIRVRPLVLFGTAAVLAVVGPLLNAAVRTALAVLQEGGSLPWTSVLTPVETLRAIALTGQYPAVTWFVYLLIGMGVAKLLLAARERGTGRRFVAGLAITGTVLTAVSLAVSELVWTLVARDRLTIEGIAPEQIEQIFKYGPSFGAPVGTDWSALFLATSHSGTTLDILRGTGVAFLVIAASLAIVGVLSERGLRMLRPVSAAGSAPLTIYSMHVLLAGAATAAVMPLIESGVIAELPWWSQGPGILAVHVALVLVLGTVLAALGRRGPLETLVASGAKQAARLGIRS